MAGALSFASSTSDPQAMSEMSLAPLAGILLILLVVFISSIAPMSDFVSLDLLPAIAYPPPNLSTPYAHAHNSTPVPLGMLQRTYPEVVAPPANMMWDDARTSVQIMIDFDGTLTWSGAELDYHGEDSLQSKLEAIGKLPIAKQLLVKIYANKLVEYKSFIEVLAMAERSGVKKIRAVGSEQFDVPLEIPNHPPVDVGIFGEGMHWSSYNSRSYKSFTPDIWKHGDFVTCFTLLILVQLGIGTWLVLFGKGIGSIQRWRQKREVERKFWRAETLGAGLLALKVSNPFRPIAVAASRVGAPISHTELNSLLQTPMRRVLENTKSAQQDRSFFFLATVASTSLLIGSFGTIWGIFIALQGSGEAGLTATLALSGPLGEALLSTLLGLAVAAPAALGCKWLLRRNKKALQEMRTFSDDVYTVILSGTMRTRI